MKKNHTNQYYVFGALLMALGDVATLLLFTFFGTMEHQMDAGFGRIFAITLPFILAWIILGLILGSYRYQAYSSGRAAMATVVKTSILAVPAAMLLRYLLQDKPFSLSFTIVSFVFVILFLSMWRAAYAWLIRNI